jgi:hypothetical protein
MGRRFLAAETVQNEPAQLDLRAIGPCCLAFWCRWAIDLQIATTIGRSFLKETIRVPDIVEGEVLESHVTFSIRVVIGAAFSYNVDRSLLIPLPSRCHC